MLNFVCVGPQRTATSWLDRALRTHPAVQLPAVVKETFFLDRRFGRGWDWYWQEFFPDLSVPGTQRGEIAPTVFDQVEAVQRLRAHNPLARIIICVRDPLERSVSLFHHYHAISRVGNDFSAATHLHPEIVRASCYREHITRWAEAFGAQRVLLVPHAAVDSDPLGTVNAIYAFLGVEGVKELPESVRDRYGVAVVPRNRWLAMLADRAAWVLRAIGLHAVVNAGKSLGLKSWLLDGGKKGPPGVPAAEWEELKVTLSADTRFAEALNQKGVVTADAAMALWKSG